MANDEMRVTVTAYIKDLLDGMRKAGDSVREATGDMKGGLAGLSNVVGMFGKAWAGIGAVLAGGAIFKEALGATKDWNGEVIKLARTLGITTEEASALNLALGDIYTDSATYIAASSMLTRQINSGGDAFKKLGVEVRDSQGKLRPTTQIMADVLDRLNKIEPGIQRNAAGMAIFSRQWGEASKLLKLSGDVLDDARQKAEKLNLVVGPGAAEAHGRYKAALNDLDDVSLGLKVTIGQELMPVLANFGQWMADVAPPVVKATSLAIKGLVGGLQVLTFALQTAWSYAKVFFGNMGESVSGLARMLKAVATGDFAGAAQAWKETENKIQANSRAFIQGMKDGYANLEVALLETATGINLTGKKGGKGGGGEGYDPGTGGGGGGKDKGADDRLKQWTADLKREAEDRAASLLATEGKYYDQSLADERRFWAAKLAMADLTAKERAAIEIKVAEIDKAMRKEALQARLDGFREEMEEAQGNLARKREIAVRERDLYVEGTAAYRDASAKIRAIDREADDERRRLLQRQIAYREEFDLALADLNIESAARMREIGTISDQEAAERVREHEREKLQIRRDALQQQLQDLQLAEEERRDLQNRMDLLNLEERRLANQQQLEAFRSIRDQAADVFQPVTEAWNASVTGMLNGSMRLSQGVQGIMKGLGRALDQAILGMVNSWIAAELKKTFATQAGTAQRTAMEGMAAIKAVGLAAWQGIKTVAIRAYEAAAGAYSAVASIPYVGPFLAPVMAGMALAGVLAMGSKIASAAGGWERVPGDQMAMIHKDEQVLPAQYAEGLRNLINGGGPNQQPAFAPSITITAMDSRDVARAFRDNDGALGRVMRDFARDFRRA